MAPRARPQEASRRLLDHVAGPRDLGTPEAIFATTFDLDRDFVELDYLPTVLGVSSWDDASPKGRLELEQQLARTDAVAIAMDGRRYQGRPRSLRVHLKPAVLPSSAMHAKVSLIVHEEAVRLIVASANLTTPGYRENRELAIAVLASSRRADEARFILGAIGPMREVLAPWWSEQAERVFAAASGKLNPWAREGGPSDDQFLWSGPGRPLWQQFIERWPDGERIDEVHIMSPFWSNEAGEGPLTRFTSSLRARGAFTERTTLRLVTRAERNGQATFCPSLPRGLAEFDFGSLGLPATAVAANPEVDPEDVGRDDLRFERILHAKAVLIVGASSSLAYVGSANFTVPGWGFGADHWSNVEAGVALLRRGRAREQLRAILPPTCGEVRLGHSTAGLVVVAEASDESESRPFPAFLRSVELHPELADPSRLELVVILEERPPSSFSLKLGDGSAATTLLAVDGTSSESRFTVALDAEMVRELLRQRAVRVYWSAPGAPVDFPVNVSTAARETLPFADPGALPREDELIAYYQGQLAFADVFPDETLDATASTPTGASGSIVDTSDILSYRMRAFIEALPGIERELSESVTHPNTIRLAFLGPVSPVALAREIAGKAAKGRSSTATGFQLVELLACVQRVEPAGALTGRLATAWTEARGAAARDIDALRGALRKSGSSDESFERYERAILGGGAS
jgi:hypothetical protein